MRTQDASIMRDELRGRTMHDARPIGRGMLAVLTVFALLVGIIGGGFAASWLRNPANPTPTGGTASFELTAFMTGFRGVGGSIDGLTNPVLAVPLGATVTITVTDGEAMMHNLVIDGFSVRSADMMALGAKAVVTFTADKEGTFAYLCAYHVSTMAGDLQVGSGATSKPGPVKPVDVQYIGREPTEVPPPITRSVAATVDIYLESKEVVAEMEPGTTYTYWTFNGHVPGPMFRVRVGDTVNVHFRNDANSTMDHSVDFHAVTGPGGGMAATMSKPGQENGFTFMALVPGLFVYHCASPHIPTHIANGMYGMILVEPVGGLPAVSHEFYVMEGDMYTKWPVHTAGHQVFDPVKLEDENPTYVVFNGKYQSLTGIHRLNASVNDTVRVFFGVGGPNLISAFHVIGEIFDVVYNLAGLTDPPMHGIQTVLVPPGGAVVVDFGLEVPGNYLLVDHSIVRTIDKGSVGILNVTGPSNPTIFNP